MPFYVHLPLFSYVGFTMNRTNFGVVTPTICGTTVELHHALYVATSLDYVIRFLDALQSLVDNQCLHEQLQELSLVEEEEGEPPEQLLMGLVEKSVDRKLDEILRSWDERLSAIERALH